MTDPSANSETPDHIGEAVRSILRLHSDHHGRTTFSQRVVNAISGAIARPFFVGLLAAAAAAWIGVDMIALGLGGRAIDPPPFPWLQGAVNVLGLFIVTLVLVAQRHEDELNARREILTLELAIMSERKIAKVIELLEELRRDTPHVRDRVDTQADEMAQPADTHSVLAAASEGAQRPPSMVDDEALPESSPVSANIRSPKST